MGKPVVAITGAAMGIGHALARRLADTHRVALLDIDIDKAEVAAAELGDGALAVHCDITDAASVTAAVARVVEHFGGLDVAVSNAGIGSGGVARHLDPNVLATQLDVNVTGNWRFIHACLPHVIARRGYVLGIASAAAIIGPPTEGFYCASKAGLEALLNVLRAEVAHLGVDVGVAYPMFINTPMVAEADIEQDDLARVRALVPAARKTYPVAMAADSLARGILRRSARVFVPGSLRWYFLLRGLLPPLLDRRFSRIAREVDALTAAKVSRRGAFEAGFNSRQITQFNRGDYNS